MINTMKKNKYMIVELIIIFIITLIFNLTCNVLVHDEVWVYGFSYNIANGLIPYKDFNMVITPLYSILGAIFMLIFGKNIVVYHIFNSIICTTIFYYIKKFTPKSYYIVYAILLFYSFPNYNLFCMLLLYILINLEKKKSNNYLIGIILGLTFITKQSIGICLCIPTLFIKDKKQIPKRILGFITPIVTMIIYLLLNDCLYEFIDYTILGIGDFAKKNSVMYSSCLIFVITSLIFLVYKYIKNREITIIYLICFLVVAFPLIDPYHVMIPFIPVLGYFLNELKLNKKIITIAFAAFIISMFAYNIYLYSTEKFSYPNNTEEYKYKKINNEVVASINNIEEYIESLEGRVFIIDMYAYLIKLEMKLPINKYDLLNDGNLGKDGEKRLLKEIDEMCQKEKCTFLLNETEIDNPDSSQYNQDIYRYIINKYKKNENIIGLTVYKNY